MKKGIFRNEKGVSLVEVLMAISIISILLGISVSGYFYYKKNSGLNLSLQQTANMIRRAKSNAVSGSSDSQWGVNIEKKKVTVFKGGSFSGRNSSFDEVVQINGVSGVSGSTSIIFAKFTGLPSSSGSVTLQSGSQNKSIQINEAGIVSY